MQEVGRILGDFYTSICWKRMCSYFSFKWSDDNYTFCIVNTQAATSSLQKVPPDPVWSQLLKNKMKIICSNIYMPVPWIKKKKKKKSVVVWVALFYHSHFLFCTHIELGREIWKLSENNQRKCIKWNKDHLFLSFLFEHISESRSYKLPPGLPI